MKPSKARTRLAIATAALIAVTGCSGSAEPAPAVTVTETAAPEPTNSTPDVGDNADGVDGAKLYKWDLGLQDILSEFQSGALKWGEGACDDDAESAACMIANMETRSHVMAGLESFVVIANDTGTEKFGDAPTVIAPTWITAFGEIQVLADQLGVMSDIPLCIEFGQGGECAAAMSELVDHMSAASESLMNAQEILRKNT